MNTVRPLAVAATLLALAACGDRPAQQDRSAAERAAAASAASAADASFDKEMGGGAAKPAAEKPVAAKPTVKPAAAKPAAAAAPTKGRPDWVDQVPVAEGKSYAVGGAPKGRRDTARVNARKELASQLRVHIQATTTVNEGEITRIGSGGERVSRAWSNYRSEARASVDRDLDFTTIIAEAEEGKECWALAELDRSAWAAKLRQELETIDARLRGEHERLAAAGGGLRPAAIALRAVGPLAARRESLVNDLMLADPQGTLPVCPIDIVALLQACAKGLGSVTIRLEGAPDAVFAARTQEAMAKQGLAVNERAGSVVVRLALRETQRLLPGQNWTRINVAGSATVVDPNTGNIAGSLQIDESAADPDAGQAKAKMLDKASAAIAKAIDERLIDLLAGGGDIGNGPAVAAPQPAAPAPAPVAPPPAVVQVTPPAPAPGAAAAPAPGVLDQHFIYSDEVFVLDDAFKPGESWSYAKLAKVRQAPSVQTKGQGQFFLIHAGKDVWTEFAYTSRVATPADLTLGQTVIVFEDNSRDSIYYPPIDQKSARTNTWFICRITDVTDLFKQQVMAGGRYQVHTSNIRVAVPLK